MDTTGELLGQTTRERDEARAEARRLRREVEELGPLGPRLGLATTRQLLREIQSRGEYDPQTKESVDMAIGAARLLDDLPGRILDYTTVGGYPS
jgi:hypothetical protein